MIQRNMEALLAILSSPDAPVEGDWVNSREELMAKYLASYGVLAPRILDVDDADEELRSQLSISPDADEGTVRVIVWTLGDKLARIAKGEP